ncbi:MAG: response regulator transcription factor [Bacteroidetes bacterium]|nr:response regulator transcription factor [Bacteroidota bacterium]
MKKFLLVDDHSIIRSGLKILLTKEFEDYQFDEASSGEECKNLVSNQQYDLIILDINIPGSDSFALVEQVMKWRADSRILIFSMSAENIYAKRFLAMGVMGYVRKDEPATEIITAVHTLLSNKKYISKTLCEIISREKFERVTDNPFKKLSPKQYEIVRFLIEGKTVSDICNFMKLHSSTVSTQKNRIFEKLHIKNLIDLYTLAKVHPISYS